VGESWFGGEAADLGSPAPSPGPSDPTGQAAADLVEQLILAVPAGCGVAT
jgi:hypothetical protein